MHKKKFSKMWKIAIQGLPLAGVLVATFIPYTQRIGQPFLVLIVLLWIQFFLITECFLVGR